MKTTILGTRQLPLPRVPTATLKGFLMVYQHKNIKHGHLKIITMIRKNDKDIKQGCNDKTNNEKPHAKVYRNWLQQQPARLDWDR